jgi:hypothetical protein
VQDAEGGEGFAVVDQVGFFEGAAEGLGEEGGAFVVNEGGGFFFVGAA